MASPDGRYQDSMPANACALAPIGVIAVFVKFFPSVEVRALTFPVVGFRDVAQERTTSK